MNEQRNPIAEIIFLLVLLALAWFAVATLIGFIRRTFGTVTVYDYQRGLKYRHGKLVQVLTAGQYFIFKPMDVIYLMDMREFVSTVVNQEILCADNLALRFSTALICSISDPVKAYQQSRNYMEILYLDAQLVMRELIAGLKVEEVLPQRNQLTESFLENMKPRAEAIGIQIHKGGVKDVTFPADVKKIFSQVIQAEKAGQASLAKARGETASLRALANAAKMMEGNPNLVTLKTLQSVSELANTTGNTIVLGLPSPLVPLNTGGKNKPAATSDDSETE